MVLDSVRSKYTDTYSKPSQEDSYRLLNDAIKEIGKHEGFDKEIKETLRLKRIKRYCAF